MKVDRKSILSDVPKALNELEGLIAYATRHAEEALVDLEEWSVIAAEAERQRAAGNIYVLEDFRESEEEWWEEMRGHAKKAVPVLTVLLNAMKELAKKV